MEAPHVVVFRRQRGVFAEAVFKPERQLPAVRGGEVRIDAVDRGLHAWNRRTEGASLPERKRHRRSLSGDVLFEAVRSVFLNGIVEKGQGVAVVEQPESGAKNERR